MSTSTNLSPELTAIEGGSVTDSTYALLSRAFEGLVGQSILEWRNGYGGSGSLHVGQRIPERSREAKKSRGEFVLTIWAASVSLASNVDAEKLSHHPPLELRELRLERFTGMQVESASVDASGKASLRIGSSAHLEIVPDDRAEVDEDQWTIETELLGTFVMRAGPTVIKE